MLVYRIEDARGYGPWSGSGTAEAYWDAAEVGTNPNDHPSPYVEGGVLYDAYVRWADGRFGCSSVEQLRDWFPCPKGREVMRQRGYRAVAYQVEPEALCEGTMQVIFQQHRAQLVKVLDLGTLQPVGNA
ncbi:hypothetical protein CYK37_30185 [Mesorhizobium loti]|nr:hypothetical protein [Mesorhizobium loti]PLP55560.1 hypothetical protein CYK37_30185 [Mesorhizobium loti]